MKSLHKAIVDISTATAVVVLLGSLASAQIDFDSPDVIQTSFARKMQEKIESQEATKTPHPVAENAEVVENGKTVDNGNVAANPGCSCGGDFVQFAPHQYAGNIGSGNLSNGCWANAMGLWQNGYGANPNDGRYSTSVDLCDCDGNGWAGSFANGIGGGQFGFSGSGIVEIPMDGVFLAGINTQVMAGTLGVPAAIWTAGTLIDLSFSDYGFEEVYRTLGGVEANFNRRINCNTTMFFGYRYVRGESNQLTLGTAIADPAGAAVSYDVNARFSDFEESRLQLGFLSNHCMRRNLEFLWGGRIGLSFVNDISAWLNSPGLVTLNNLRIYDDTTNLAFGFNFGFQRRFGCNMTVHALTGIEYRTSLNEFDTQLATYGLSQLNNGSGFASLPVYLGFSYQR